MILQKHLQLIPSHNHLEHKVTLGYQFMIYVIPGMETTI